MSSTPKFQIDYKAIVEAADAIFVRSYRETEKLAHRTVVVFRASAIEPEISIYGMALRSADDVLMAIKSKREHDERKHVC